MPAEFDFLSITGRDDAFIPLQAGEVLFDKGDQAHTMFVVRSGRIEIFDGTVILETAGAGAIVGEMAVVDAEPRSASARALVASEVIAIDQPHFMEMVGKTPAFAIQVMRVMGRRLRAMNDRLRNSA